jgi:hypothetical protein
MIPMSYKKDPYHIAGVSIDALNASRADLNLAEDAVRLGSRKYGEFINPKLFEEAYNARRQMTVDPAVALMQATYGATDQMESKVGRMLGSAQTRGRGIMGALSKSKKPLLVAGAVAAGVMLMSPSISGSIGSGESPKGGRGMTSDSFGPPGGQGMSPPPPRPNLAPRIYDTGGVRQTSRANIRMRTNDLNNSSRDFMQSARELSNGSNIHIRARDDRSALDPQSLANKIGDRL